MRESLTQVLNRLKPRLGGWENPRPDGWMNFERCPFKEHRKRWVFGVNLKKGFYKCMSCGAFGRAHEIGFPLDTSRLIRKRLAPQRLAPSVPPPEQSELPWARITARGRTKLLEQDALRYLHSRGISRLRAATYGLGYGIEGKWGGCVIHPFYDMDGTTLRGWQARVQGNPESGPKVLTTSPNKDGKWVWGAYDGALYNFDRIPRGSVLTLAEGPYDALSIDRVTPAVALLGSALTDKQMSRILRKRPKEIIVAFDKDKSPEMRAVAARLFKRTHAPVFWVDYHAGWAGDWAAAPNGAPRCADSVYEQIHLFTRQYEPGH